VPRHTIEIMGTPAPYGSWKSPIDAAATVSGLIEFDNLAFDDGNLYWIELRPGEEGRQVLVRRDTSGSIEDLTPPPTNVRTRVHEYGGGAYAVGHGSVVFSDFATQRLYRLDGGEQIAVTPQPPRVASLRYADGRILSGDRMVWVRESHPEKGEAVNELVLVNLLTGELQTLASGRDFYATPRPSHDESRMAWVEWDHPNMPWDGTELKVARLVDGELSDIVTVAGGEGESIVQPEWTPDQSLIFHSDRSGWWNLHRWDGIAVSPLLTRDADFAEPAWTFGRPTFGFLANGRILGGLWKDGTHRLVIIGPDGHLEELEDDLSMHGRITTDGNATAWFVGQGPATPLGLFELDTASGERRTVRSNLKPADPSYFCQPRAISFPTGNGEVAHGIYYPPHNPEYTGLADELPPLIVRIHGGPTSHVMPRLAVAFLYWTTRGFGVVDVNYRGSSGYGREYRNRLRGTWGIVDVEDAQAAARYLAEQGEVDAERLVITGGSAGGYTTLAALAFGDVFRAGSSYFGVADLELLAKHTHKFESRYLDGLVGTDVEEMRRRSPLYSTDRIDVPVILFQGLDDQVVPPEQAEMIAAALEERGVPYALVTYEGEDHGFRQAKNIVHSLESELAFYALVLRFTPDGELPEVPIVGELSPTRQAVDT
jgi:dipeptidyl aminopeptidase/acylaminoacyl peptidase